MKVFTLAVFLSLGFGGLDAMAADHEYQSPARQASLCWQMQEEKSNGRMALASIAGCAAWNYGAYISIGSLCEVNLPICIISSVIGGIVTVLGDGAFVCLTEKYARKFATGNYQKRLVEAAYLVKKNEDQKCRNKAGRAHFDHELANAYQLLDKLVYQYNLNHPSKTISEKHLAELIILANEAGKFAQMEAFENKKIQELYPLAKDKPQIKNFLTNGSTGSFVKESSSKIVELLCQTGSTKSKDYWNTQKQAFCANLQKYNREAEKYLSDCRSQTQQK